MKKSTTGQAAITSPAKNVSNAKKSAKASDKVKTRKAV